MQECDTVINAPFKRAIKAAFRDYLHGKFTEYLESADPQPDPALWEPNFKMSALKPVITSFVQEGIAALKTESMRETIKTAFAKDGMFERMRGPEGLAVVAAAAVDGNNLAHQVPEGAERDDDEVAREEEEALYDDDVDTVMDLIAEHLNVGINESDSDEE